MTALAFNRRLSHDYEIIDKYKAGVVLHGYEVKAAREGKVDFTDSYIKVEGGKLILVNLHIGRYSSQSQEVPDEQTRRPRELLLNGWEIQRLSQKTAEKGFSLVPLQLMNDHGLIKLELALVKGKKKFEKREDLKKKQTEMDMKRELRG